MVPKPYLCALSELGVPPIRPRVGPPDTSRQIPSRDGTRGAEAREEQRHERSRGMRGAVALEAQWHERSRGIRGAEAQEQSDLKSAAAFTYLHRGGVTEPVGPILKLLSIIYLARTRHSF